MNILVINCGSSSLKFQLINSDTEAVLAKGICERIGAAGSQLVYKPAEGEKQTVEAPMDDHTAAIRMVLSALSDKETGGNGKKRRRGSWNRRFAKRRKQCAERTNKRNGGFW